MKKIFNIALLSVFISGISVNYLSADPSSTVGVAKSSVRDVYGTPLKKRAYNRGYSDGRKVGKTEALSNNMDFYNRGYRGGYDVGKSDGRRAERQDIIKSNSEKTNAFITVEKTVGYYVQHTNDNADIQTVLKYLKTDNEINKLFNKSSSNEGFFYDVADSLGSYKNVLDYSYLSKDGSVKVKAIESRKTALGEQDNKFDTVNALVAFKWTLAIYRSMLDYNGFELNRNDIIKIYKSVLALINHAPRNIIEISPKIERKNAADTLFKKVWDGKGEIKTLPVVLKIKLNKGDTNGVFGYLRLTGIGNKLTEKGRIGRKITADFFMPNNTEIKGQLGKRFYIDKSKALDAAANKKWHEIPELQNLFAKTKPINWKPRVIKDTDFEIKNITLENILKVCINADVQCDTQFKDEYVKIYTPEYIDFTGYDNVDKGNYLLNQQKGRYISELFKYDNGDDTYTVVIGVIKNGKALANSKEFLFKGKTVVKNLSRVHEFVLNEGTEGANRRKRPGKTYVFDVVKDVHNVIYILKVKRGLYDALIKSIKKYNII